VEGDRDAGSWRKKLEVVERLLRAEGEAGPGEEALACCAVYLQWVASGAIRCVEDGGHHRPCRHAEIGREIFRLLEALPAARGGQLLAARSLHPKLPSFKSEFTASVPLTRIRDIAHRNDIPSELKQEIKHTIQNKLHRNAGPEDLVATEAMLGRITGGGGGEYPEDFIREFRTFHRELKEFFNATTLDERLEEARSQLQGPDLDRFFEAKAAYARGGSAKAAVALLRAATALRAGLLEGPLSTFDAGAISEEAIAQRQLLRLSEIGLEDYAFVVSSSLLNSLEAEGGGLAPPAVLALSELVRQVGLSSWEPEECEAIQGEMGSVVELWPTGAALEEDLALRLVSAMERTRRVAERYTDTLLGLYVERSQALGSALGIPDHIIQTFTEAEVRASLVFQVSKIVSLVLKEAREALGVDAWDALVLGSCSGTFLAVDSIYPGVVPSEYAGQDVVLLVAQATGDEEVKAAGENIRGVVLCHELPHLSHLGVRARQEAVVFATCTDKDVAGGLRGMVGSIVDFEAAPEGVSVRGAGSSAAIPAAAAATPALASAPAPAPADPATREESLTASTVYERFLADPQNPFREPEADIGEATEIHPALAKEASSSPVLALGLGDAKPELCGAKAATCGRLAVLAQESCEGAAFRAPAGGCLPFGALHDAISAAGVCSEFDVLLAAVEEAASDSDELLEGCRRLQDFVRMLRPVPAALSSLSDLFRSGNRRVIVRSSSNVEDLKGMSGAGLYESIPNIDALDSEDLGRAVAEVWASLYTRRAVLSRRAAGVPQKDAYMAVLVQELLAPEVSFVLHTVNPTSANPRQLYAELAVGLGETLAAGTAGTPWRLEVDKDTWAVKTRALANFSHALRVDPQGGFAGAVLEETVDYSCQPLSTDPEVRARVGESLGRVGALLEDALGEPQDVEGGFVGGVVYVVQSRPQE
jgi:phosphoglucan,water dikinase